MQTSLFILTIILFVYALAATIHTELPKRVRNMSFVYYAFSLPVHFLATQLLIIAVVLLVLSLTVYAPAPYMSVLSGLTIGLLLLNLWRSIKGCIVLEKICPDGDTSWKWEAIKGALRPLRISKKGVTRIEDIRYGDQERQVLDIYVPEMLPDAPMPILIHIHGGAWIIGSKQQQARPLIYHMARQGWLVVDINYRLGPKHRFPAMIEDVLRAVAWVKANASEYGGDFGFVALTGGSAGGHLTALAALAYDHAAFKPGIEDADCRVDAAIPVYGVYDFTNQYDQIQLGMDEAEAFITKYAMPGPRETHEALWQDLSPISHVRADAPPFLVLHGKHDSLADFKGAEKFVEILRDTSKNPVHFGALPSGEHAYDNLNGPPTMSHIHVIERFLKLERANC